ncbi:MAG TPA: ATP-dependent Clp protease proteolytic subunit [Nitrosomonas sp.]|nr:ATP-dependent Clp protease proteolytic subunit [Nitrosomonas sp.]
MNQDSTGRKISIRDAIVELETNRSSTVISYIGAQSALVGPEDAGLLVDAIEMVLPDSGKIKKLDLFINSPGGFLDSAYKIVKICREYSDQFNVIVPFAAKSAATVICIGATEIVMTSLSELGPIDPIIQHPYKPDVRVPARSIKDFFTFLNTTETQNITVDPSFKTQMANMLDPYLIGSYHTALQSSKQIATLLLGETSLKNDPTKLADTVNKLTEFYFSHGFVIDRQAARDMGLNVTNADENRSLLKSIRQLFHIYQQFMASNNIVKLVGNRDVNRTIQVQPQVVSPVVPTPPTNLIF